MWLWYISFFNCTEFSVFIIVLKLHSFLFRNQSLRVGWVHFKQLHNLQQSWNRAYRNVCTPFYTTQELLPYFYLSQLSVHIFSANTHLLFLCILPTSYLSIYRDIKHANAKSVFVFEMHHKWSMSYAKIYIFP